MATFGGMSLPVQATIKELTPTAVANAMGLPVSTVFRWMKTDRIPGVKAAHEWRRNQFEAAVNRLRAEAKEETKRQKRAA